MLCERFSDIVVYESNIRSPIKLPNTKATADIIEDGDLAGFGDIS